MNRKVIQFILHRHPATNHSLKVAYCRYESAIDTTSLLSSNLQINGQYVMIDRAVMADTQLIGAKMTFDSGSLLGKRSRLDQISMMNSTNNVLIVGTRKVTIDPNEDSSCVVLVTGAVDASELEVSSTFFEISADFERQLSKFGEVKSMKILRRSEGYSSCAGNVNPNMFFDDNDEFGDVL